MANLIDLRKNVRLLLGDMDADDYAIDSDRMNLVILEKSQKFGGEVLPGQSWVIAALTATPGASDASFAVNQYLTVIDLRRQIDGIVIDKLPEAYVEQLRQGPQIGTGLPECWYPIEDSSVRLSARFYPAPALAYVFDALVTTMADGTVSDSTIVPCSDFALRAIEREAAVELLIGMPDEDAARLSRSKELAKAWAADAADLTIKERQRKQRLGAVAAVPPVIE